MKGKSHTPEQVLRKLAEGEQIRAQATWMFAPLQEHSHKPEE